VLFIVSYCSTLLIRLFVYTCTAVVCQSLTGLSNGIMTCSPGDDEIFFYEDVCSLTCNTGYELTGSHTRTCRSDGKWSGSETICRRSKRCCCVMIFVQIICMIIVTH